MKAPVIVWLRRDLRVTDNTALDHAISTQQPVIALFIETPHQWQQHHASPIQIDFIERRLHEVKSELDAMGIPLLFERCDSFKEVPATIMAVIEACHAQQLFFNKEYEVNECERDRHVDQRLKASGIATSTFDDTCILTPGSVLNGHGEMYKVFTPFRKAWLRLLKEQSEYGAGSYLAHTDTESENNSAKKVSKVDVRATLPVGVGISELCFVSEKRDSSAYPVKSHELSTILSRFVEQKSSQYHLDRDFPAVDGTSQLSPYLAIGAISARQCLSALKMFNPECDEQAKNGAFVWLSEVIWREFYKHLLAAYPRLSQHEPFIAWSREVKWEGGSTALEAWKHGKTGYPIVDAAMRQLNHTGWMHNRLRMIVASFLTKDLLIDWRKGEEYFISMLIDGDLSANNGGWQWAASTGTDAQPYFRIFNPTIQGQRFDPDGAFIRQWLPELASCPEALIHEPALWSGFAECGYPLPIVNHKEARTIAMERFRTAKANYEAATDLRNNTLSTL